MQLGGGTERSCRSKITRDRLERLFFNMRYRALRPTADDAATLESVRQLHAAVAARDVSLPYLPYVSARATFTSLLPAKPNSIRQVGSQQRILQTRSLAAPSPTVTSWNPGGGSVG